MAALYVFISLFIAITMVLLLNASVDIKYHKGFRLVLTLNIISIIFSRKKHKSDTKQNKVDKYKHSSRSSSISPLIIFELLKHSDICINKISIPSLSFLNIIIPHYQRESFIFAFLSVIIAYLDTNTAKLLQKPQAYIKDGEHLIVDITAKAPIYRIIFSLISFKIKNAARFKRRKYV